jgi:hypothetical protein
MTGLVFVCNRFAHIVEASRPLIQLWQVDICSTNSTENCPHNPELIAAPAAIEPAMSRVRPSAPRLAATACVCEWLLLINLIVCIGLHVSLYLGRSRLRPNGAHVSTPACAEPYPPSLWYSCHCLHMVSSFLLQIRPQAHQRLVSNMPTQSTWCCGVFMQPRLMFGRVGQPVDISCIGRRIVE